MSPIVQKALQAITDRTNLSTGLTHPNDKNAAKEMFVLLHEHGEILLANEIESWASSNGWQASDAKELASLGEQIGAGKKPRVTGGPWWRDDILSTFSEAES
jgi:hypothetical protein